MSTVGEHVVKLHTHTHTHALSSQGENDIDKLEVGPEMPSYAIKMIDGSWKSVWEMSWRGGSLGRWPRLCIRMLFSQKCCYCNTAGDEPGLIQRLSDSTTERDTCVVCLPKTVNNEWTVNSVTRRGQWSQILLKGGEGWGTQTGLGLIISLSGSELLWWQQQQEGLNWVDLNPTETWF